MLKQHAPEPHAVSRCTNARDAFGSDSSVIVRIPVLFCSHLLRSDQTVFAEALLHSLGAATGCAMAFMAAEALTLLLRDRRTNWGQRLGDVWGSLMAVVEGMLAAEPRSGSRDRHRTEEGPRRQGGEVETLVAYQSSLALASAEAGRHQQLPPSEMMRQRQELRQQLLALRRQLDNLSGGDASPQKRRGEMSAREAFGSPTPAEETWGLAVQEAGEHRMEVRPGGLRTGPGTESSCRQDVAPLTISQGLHTWDPVHEGRGSIVFDGEVIVQGQPMRVVSVVKRNPGSDCSDYTFEDKVCAPLKCSLCRCCDRFGLTAIIPLFTVRCRSYLVNRRRPRLQITGPRACRRPRLQTISPLAYSSSIMLSCWPGNRVQLRMMVTRREQK